MNLEILKKISVAVVWFTIATVNVFAADVTAVAQTPAQGESFYIDFNFKIPAKEHVYSNTPSDIGSPTTVSLKLPTGYKLENTEWPKPKEFAYFGMQSMGYSGDFTVRAKISAPAKFIKDTMATATAQVEMLACSDMCVPVKKDFQFTLPKAAKSSSSILSANLANNISTDSPNAKILIFSILAAFAGGAILNLMPCVFPVIGIKILSFASAASDRRVSIFGALAYSGGILASFLALAALLIILRAAGSELGWGFQLQNPIFTALMALLFFGMALSFAGAFEIGAGFAGGASEDSKRNKYVSSALSGVLAVLVASPCTAPFMGAAVGAALAADASGIFTFSVFAALGLGMAAPYLILSAIPSLAKKIPRPGPWMETLKQILSIPLFASAVWLAWVYCNQTDSPARIMSAALVLAIGLRAFGLFYMPHFGKLTRALAFCVCIFSIFAAVWIAADFTPTQSASKVVSQNTWSQQKLDNLRAEGRIVYVDFTASWCLTCQFNKTVLHSKKVSAIFKKYNVALLVGDWTNKDPLISRELAKFGRAGVPLNMVYSPDPAKKPIVLPALLTEAEVIEAIDKSAR